MQITQKKNKQLLAFRILSFSGCMQTFGALLYSIPQDTQSSFSDRLRSANTLTYLNDLSYSRKVYGFYRYLDDFVLSVCSALLFFHMLPPIEYPSRESVFYDFSLRRPRKNTYCYLCLVAWTRFLMPDFSITTVHVIREFISSLIGKTLLSNNFQEAINFIILLSV